ncbi:DUF5522 domain-containing protein [Bernardetia sp. MNP-M8]|uniref:DUF5522 domain-containing protein n=1 Tax=Bernardetia sp. MNP-M8 TaxID=3127470 RepID=UPI0030CB0960
MFEKPLSQIEKGDFYFNEEGLMVFTAQYHLKRGYCCKNICLNCPWDYKREKHKTKK